PRPDVILSYWADPDGTAAVRWGARARVPVVQMVGGSDVLLLARDPRRGARILETLNRAQKVVAIGSDLAAKLVSLRLPPAKVAPYERGVDTSVFSRGDRAAARVRLSLPVDRPVLLWVGRMVPVKGLKFLLEALDSTAFDEIDPLLV